MSLRTKVMLPLAIFSALFIAYLYGYYIPRSREEMETEYRQAIERHLDSVAEGVIPLLLGRQLDAVYEYLDVLKKRNKDWVTIELIDPDGRTIYPLQAPRATLKNGPEVQVHAVRQRIEYLNMDLGTIVLSVDFAPRLSEMGKRHQHLMTALLIILFAFMTTAMIIVERVVRRPVNLLAHASGKLAQGIFDVPLVKTGKDEVGVLVDSFGKMRDAIQENQAELLRKSYVIMRSERKLEEAQRIAHLGSWELDLTNNKLVWSDESYRIFGMDPQAFGATYEAFLETIHPDDRAGVDAAYTVSLRDGSPYDIVHRIVRKADNEIRYVHEKCEHIKDDSGRIIRSLGTVQDITERKRDEEKLKLANAYNRSLIEASLDPLVTIDTSGKITDANAATEYVTGHDRKALIGTDFSDYFTEPGKAREGYQQVFREGSVRDYPLELRHREGRVTSVLYNASVYRDEGGRVVGVFAAARDISERKRTERAMRLLGSIVEYSNDAIIGKDLEGIITSWNKGAERILGYHEKEAVGNPIGMLIPEERKDEELRILEKIKRGDPIEHFETERQRKDGSLISVSLTISPIKDGEERIVGASTIARDISERKGTENEIRRLNQELEQRVIRRTADLEHKSRELQDSQQALVNIVDDLNTKTEELERANAKLKELDRLKSLFIASMSHELRTPLNSVIGFSSILLNEWTGPLTAEQKENLATILRSGKHLLNLINDVIDVSKIEAGKVESNAEEFDLHDLVSEAISLVQADAQGKKLALTFDTNHHQMRTDRRRLLQSVINLLSNAVKFTEQGSITVRARRVGSSELGVGSEKKVSERGTQNAALHEDFIEISVADTGMGIKEEDMQKLFQPFSRLVSPNQATIAGTGLGLYLTHKLVTEVLKGDILCTSAYGKGSTFTIRIPSRLL